jgi:hypothetical protein
MTNPQPKYGQFGYNAQPEMVVDVKVKVDEEILEFKQLSANARKKNMF